MDVAGDTGFATLMADVRLDRAAPLREQIYQLIRRMIVTGLLRPGDTIHEMTIADRLDLSRTPVREAIKRISDEGLVEVRAQSGTFVAPITAREVEEAYLIRTALELESVRRAATAFAEEHRRRLEAVTAAHRAALDRGDYAEAIARDDDFHRAIAEINGLHRLWRAVDLSKAQMDRCRYLSLPQPGHADATIRQHEAIVEALAANDAEAAHAAMKHHLDTSLGNSLSVLGQVDFGTAPSKRRARRTRS
jgi:DNA-binding GntR family transcriptional regulator